MLRNKALLAALATFAVYACAFIYRTSYVIDGERFFTLFDDGMISMRYAKNLAGGFGLVWNAGAERIEGYTNLLWTLYMAALHLLPVPASKIGLLVQLTGAILLLLNLIFIAKIARTLANGSTVAATVAVILTAFYLPLNTWALQGMEVSALALLLSASVWLALQYPSAPRQVALLYVMLGIGTLVRVDMTVPFLAIMGTVALTDPERRRTHLAIGIATLIAFVSAQTAFRWLYYGDFLPNTYYLKMTGYPVMLRITRGYLVFLDFLFRFNVLIFLLPLCYAVVREDRRLRLLLTVVVMQIGYSIYVGGDAWEWWGGCNRYIVIAMPLLFVLLACAVVYAVQFLEPLMRGNKASRLAMPAIVFLVLLNVNAIRGPEAWSEWLLLSKSLHIDNNKGAVEIGQLVKSITTNQAKVAVVWAGATPYFMDRYAIDILGKNDRVIAHENMHLAPPGTSPSTYFYPGHLKYDYAYSLGKLQPDVVTQIWGDPAESAPYLASYKRITLSGLTLLLRDDSPNIRWDKVQALASEHGAG